MAHPLQLHVDVVRKGEAAQHGEAVRRRVATGSAGAGPRRPGEALLHPIALGAIGLLVVNDHVLKAAYPGFVTGKLSDVAGLAFFPLFLIAAYELVIRRTASARAVVVAVTSTALVFSLVQIWPVATDAYRFGLGAIQWPFRLIAAGGIVDLVPVQVMPDPSDLITVPAVLIALAIGWPGDVREDERPAPHASCTSSS